MGEKFKESLKLAGQAKKSGQFNLNLTLISPRDGGSDMM
jgi:hypothetical protein